MKSIETAWRRCTTEGLGQYDRGGMIEEICRWRMRLGTVVFMYTPAHSGITPNEYADAAAKAGARSEEVHGDARAIARMVAKRGRQTKRYGINLTMKGPSGGTVTFRTTEDVREGTELKIDYGDEYWDARTGGFGVGSQWWGTDVQGAGDWVENGRVRAEEWTGDTSDGPGEVTIKVSILNTNGRGEDGWAPIVESRDWPATATAEEVQWWVAGTRGGQLATAAGDGGWHIRIQATGEAYITLQG